MIDRTHRELAEEDIARIANTYHAWRGEEEVEEYIDVPGFCKSAALEEVRNHNYHLTPGRYVGMEPQEDDVLFEERMAQLANAWYEQRSESLQIEQQIIISLSQLGFAKSDNESSIQ